MDLQGLHEVLIASEHKEDSSIMLTAIVEVMVNGYIKRNGREVQISMRERGKEVLPEQEDLEEAMKASSAASRYSLAQTLAVPLSGHDEMELTIRSGRKYCGRVRFRCTDSTIPPVHTDAVLAIVRNKEDAAVFFRELDIPDDTPVVFAVITEKEPDQNDSAEDELRKFTDLSDPLFFNRRIFIGWYNSFGFLNGKTRTPESALPYGVENLFWKLMDAAGRARYSYLNDIIKESEKAIKRRASVFQKGSVRRTIELRLARENYSLAVRDIYGTEQLIAVTEGTALFDDQ